ncbi:MAG: alpha/beta fold hydrolase [Candidatus Melainabacteria bacterium]|nr:alpha/beta fold hydrolase [Candidatus Melainabacteria bacterium]
MVWLRSTGIGKKELSLAAALLISASTLTPVLAADSSNQDYSSPSPDSPSLDSPSPDSPSLDSPSPDSPSLDSPSPDRPSLDSPSPDSPSLDSPSPDSPSPDSPSPDSPDLTATIQTSPDPAPADPTPDLSTGTLERNAREFGLGDLDLPVYAWLPTDDHPRAVILALHGGCLSGRSFKHLGHKLTRKGYAVVSLDLRGYGKWREGFGTKKDRNFDYRKSRQDVSTLLQHINASYPEVPVFCIGESLGTSMAAVATNENPGMIDGTIMTSTYANASFFLYPEMLGTLWDFLKRPWKELDLTPYLVRRLSHDRLLAIQQVNEPDSRNEQSLAQLMRSFFINRKGRIEAAKISADVPVLFIHGKLDRLCRPDMTRELYESIPSKDKKFVMVEDQGHLIVETPSIKPEVLDTLTSWLDNHTEQARLARAQRHEPVRTARAHTQPHYPRSKGSFYALFPALKILRP